MFRLPLWMPVMLLAGCATLTPEQCRNADWRQIGFADGTGGYNAMRINDHAKACAEVGVRPNLDDYVDGREQGLRNYCRAENGFAIGRRGASANVADCPENMKFAFAEQYRYGQQIHLMEEDLAQRRSRIYQNNSRIRRNNERIAVIRAELVKKELPDDRRTTLLNEYDRLVEQKNVIGRENAYLAAEADRLQFHLQLKLREFGLWR
jgi:hypothetical protein